MDKIKWLTKDLGKYVWRKEDEDETEGLYIFKITPVEKDLGYDEVFVGYYVVFEVDGDGNVERRAWIEGVRQYDYERDWYTGSEHWEEQEWEEEIEFLKQFKIEDFISGRVDDLEEGVDFRFV